MRCKTLLIALALSVCATSAMAEQQFANIGDFELVSGEVIEDCRVGYRVMGRANTDKSNVLVMPSWFDGTSNSMIDYGLVGSGKLADTDRHYVILFDALGNGVSSSPSNSASQGADDFPRITIEDMVRSQHRVLTGHFGINRVKAVMGISMGGMQTFQWMTSYPEFMDKAVPVDGSPRMTSYDIIQWQTHKDVIQFMQQAGKSGDEIAALVSPMTLLSLWTPDYFIENVAPESLGEFLDESLASYRGFNGYDYVSQLDAMIAVDLLGSSDASRRKYLDRIKADTLVVGVPSDHMVNPTPAKKVAELLQVPYFEVMSNCGHMGTTCEIEKVAARINEFLE